MSNNAVQKPICIYGAMSTLTGRPLSELFLASLASLDHVCHHGQNSRQL